MPLDLSATVAAPVSLADYTRADLIVPELRERDTAGILSELSQAFHRAGCFPDVLPFYHAALNQELLCDSAQDCGIALPHARLAGVKRLQFAFGKTAAPVRWGAKNSWPVQMVFLLAVPATDAANYLHLLASLARLAQQQAVLASLRAANDTQSILQLLRQSKVRQE